MSIKCFYCGKTKKENSFFIGASVRPSWCKIEGTGKMSCPDCYSVAAEEGRTAVNNYIKSINKKYQNNS